MATLSCVDARFDLSAGQVLDGHHARFAAFPNFKTLNVCQGRLCRVKFGQIGVIMAIGVAEEGFGVGYCVKL